MRNIRLANPLLLLLLGISLSSTAEARWSATSQNGHFTVTVFSTDGEYPIGDFHNWTLQLTGAAGESIENARINVDGGMRAHGHGLPSQPQVTGQIDNGNYLIEGMLFNMAGKWTLLIDIQTARRRDTAQVEFNLKF